MDADDVLASLDLRAEGLLLLEDAPATEGLLVPFATTLATDLVVENDPPGALQDLRAGSSSVHSNNWSHVRRARRAAKG